MLKTKIIPVIHYENNAQTMRNAERAFAAGSDGLFLIEMNANNNLLIEPAEMLRKAYPEKELGLNLLGIEPTRAICINAILGMDMTWTDEQPTHSSLDPWFDADEISFEMTDHMTHELFCGVAFKHQKSEPDPSLSARKAVEMGFIPTTSGEATGVAAKADKIADMRKAIGPDAPLAIASGITPDNVHEFAPHLTHILVATGISSSFYEFDPAMLQDLVSNVRA